MNPNSITLKQGTNYYSNKTGKLQGTVQYDTQTGQKLAPGQTTVQTIPGNTITTDSLVKKPSVILPNQSTGLNPADNALMGNINNSVIKASTNPNLDAQGNPIPINTKTQFNNLITDLGNRGAVTDKAMTDAGIADKKKIYDTQSAEILKADQAHKNAIDALYGQGGTTREQVQPAITENQRLYASQAADRAIAQSIATNDYNTALDTVNKKIDAQFQRDKDQIDALVKFQQYNNNDLTDKQKMLLAEQIDNRKIALQSKTELAQYKEKANIDALALANLNTNYTPQAQTEYTVKSTDNGGLYKITQDNGLDFEALKAANTNLFNKNLPIDSNQNWKIKTGDVIKLPTAKDMIDPPVPYTLAPYISNTYSGTKYMDASTIQGTAKEKTQLINQAASLGFKIITNKNTAADLVNINDAFNKLDTVGSILQTIDQPDALSRNLYGAGLTKLSSLAQTNPQKAAAGALQGIGLDMLKALSGVQGFRGNSTVVAQITKHLPTIYDTNDTAVQKLSYIRSLIKDRENGIFGIKSNEVTNYNGYTLPGNNINDSVSSSYNNYKLTN